MSTSPSAKKGGYHHGTLREALIEAGLVILGEGVDPATFSLREAARRAGVSAMAPYRHFPDKEALLAAVAAVGFERLAAAQREADAHADPTEALVGQGVAYVRFACAEPALFRLMFGAGAVAKSGDLAAAAQRSYRLLADRVAALVPPEHAVIATLRSWSLAHGLAALAVDKNFGPIEGEALALAEQALRFEVRPPVAVRTESDSRPN